MRSIFSLILAAFFWFISMSAYADEVSQPEEKIQSLVSNYGHYVEVEKNVDLFYIDKGEGIPIIFIPGWTFTSDAFLKQIEYFSQNHRVIAIDPRSQGRSTVTVDGNDYKTHGRDLTELIRKLNLKDVIIVGWSFGAFDAWEYVEHNGTNNLKAFVVIDNKPKTILDDKLGSLPNQYLNLLDSPANYRDFMRQFAIKKLVTHPVTTESEINLLVGESLRMPYTAARDLYVSGWFGNQEETMKKIAKKVPTLMFLSEGRVEPTKTFMKEHCPQTKIYIMGKHMMFWEFPEEFNRELNTFLKDSGI